VELPRLERWLAREAERVVSRFDASGTVDLWHAHPDPHGYGNAGTDARHAVLRRLFGVFAQLADRLWVRRHDLQLFVSVAADDSASDAVYVHTSRAAAAPFPYVAAGFSGCADLPDWLARHVDAAEQAVGAKRWDDTTFYLIEYTGWPHRVLGRAADPRS